MPRPALSLKARALRYLSAREHSRSELARKLSRYATEDDDIEALLDQLEAARLLSNERFSDSLVNRRSARFGNRRILSELKSHGLEGDTLQRVKENISQDETARAREVLRKKFGTVAADSAEERGRRVRFLMQRGFSSEAIRGTSRDEDDEPAE